MGLWGDWRPVVAMLAVDAVLAVMNIMIKLVVDEGMHPLVLITLRHLVATLFMAPIAYFRERKSRPKLTREILIYLFFSAMLGVTLAQYLFFIGLRLTSATFSCAFLNMAPAFTFLIALPVRMETLDVKSKAGLAKLLGTVLCAGGAVLLTMYKGVALTNTAHREAAAAQQARHVAGYGKKRWMLGSIALLAGTFSWSAWFLLQSKLAKKYPALYSASAIIFFLGFLQGAALSLATQRRISVWVLRSKIEIATVLVAGIAGSGLCFLTMSWCVKERGPVFTAALTTPLVQIFVGGIDFAILHEQLHLGNVLGSILVIAGLYFLLWGQNKEAQSCAVKQTEANGQP